jgi:hypothetical protein
MQNHERPGEVAKRLECAVFRRFDIVQEADEEAEKEKESRAPEYGALQTLREVRNQWRRRTSRRSMRRV